MLICEYKIYQLIIANDDESQAWQSTNSKLLQNFQRFLAEFKIKFLQNKASKLFKFKHKF